jgi:hypothetical protein
VTLEMVIPAATPSLNAFAKAHFRTYNAIRQTWVGHVRDGFFDALARAGRHAERWPTPPHAKVRLTVTRVIKSGQLLDLDNLVGGLKPVIDALKINGLIDDDNPHALDLVATQEINPHAVDPIRRYTVIRLDRLHAITQPPLGMVDARARQSNDATTERH